MCNNRRTLLVPALSLCFLLVIAVRGYAQVDLPTTDRCRELLRSSVIDFYLPFCVDQEFGGYHQEIDESQRPPRFHGDSKFLTLQARQLWFFSSLAVADIRRDEAMTAARMGYEFLREHFFDVEHGGYYSIVARDGTPQDTRKHAYLNAFVIYALVEYYRATRDEQVLHQAMELFETWEQHAHDRTHLGYEEFFDRQWQPIRDAQQSGFVGAIGVKTYNTHLHWMEAFTELYLETHDSRVAERLRELIRINTETVKHPSNPCNIDAWHPDWTIVETPENLRASYGHDIECVWLVLRAVWALEESWEPYRAWATQTCDYVLKHGYDRQHGGLYASGPLGQFADRRRKDWWPQAEALVGFLVMHRWTGDPKYLDPFTRTFHFVAKYQVHPHGSWWAVVDEDGSVGENKTRTGMWQGAYHTGRSLMMLERILSHAEPMLQDQATTRQ